MANQFDFISDMLLAAYTQTQTQKSNLIGREVQLQYLSTDHCQKYERGVQGKVDGSKIKAIETQAQTQMSNKKELQH